MLRSIGSPLAPEGGTFTQTYKKMLSFLESIFLFISIGIPPLGVRGLLFPPKSGSGRYVWPLLK
jgi:hypothetical protein